MKTASVHDLKNDLKLMFGKRFLGHGFDLPVVFYTGKLCFHHLLLLGCRFLVSLPFEWLTFRVESSENDMSV